MTIYGLLYAAFAVYMATSGDVAIINWIQTNRALKLNLKSFWVNLKASCF